MAPVALESPGLRARVLRQRRVGLLALIVGTAITVIALGSMLLVDRISSEHQAAFHRYPGTVVWVHESADSDDSGGTALVQFDEAGRTRRRRIQVGSTSDWIAGETVHVLVDPTDSSFVTLPGEHYLPNWWGSLLLATCGLACVPLGGLAWFRTARRKLAALAATPWRTEVGETRGPEDASYTVYFARVEGGSFWRSSSRVVSSEGRFVAEIAGDRAHGLVIRPAGSRKLILARPMVSTGPASCRVLAVQRRKGVLAIRLDGPTESAVYGIREANNAAAFDEKLLEDVDTAVLRACSASWGALYLSGLEITLLGVRVTDRRARRRWPALFEAEVTQGESDLRAIGETRA